MSRCCIGQIVRINTCNENVDALPFAGEFGIVKQIHTVGGVVSDYTVDVKGEDVFCAEHGVDILSVMFVHRS